MRIYFSRYGRLPLFWSKFENVLREVAKLYDKIKWDEMKWKAVSLFLTIFTVKWRREPRSLFTRSIREPGSSRRSSSSSRNAIFTVPILAPFACSFLNNSIKFMLLKTLIRFNFSRLHHLIALLSVAIPFVLNSRFNYRNQNPTWCWCRKDGRCRRMRTQWDYSVTQRSVNLRLADLRELCFSWSYETLWDLKGRWVNGVNDDCDWSVFSVHHWWATRSSVRCFNAHVGAYRAPRKWQRLTFYATQPAINRQWGDGSPC